MDSNCEWQATQSRQPWALTLCSLYMIPGAPSPLERVSLGDSNLALVYGGNLARLWDVRTKEFWRSTTIDKVEEMFKQGGWASL
jgi:hypothetical protein